MKRIQKAWKAFDDFWTIKRGLLYGIPLCALTILVWFFPAKVQEWKEWLWK